MKISITTAMIHRDTCFCNSSPSIRRSVLLVVLAGWRQLLDRYHIASLYMFHMFDISVQMHDQQSIQEWPTVKNVLTVRSYYLYHTYMYMHRQQIIGYFNFSFSASFIRSSLSNKRIGLVFNSSPNAVDNSLGCKQQSTLIDANLSYSNW